MSELRETVAELRKRLAEAKPLPWEWIAIDSQTLALGTEGCADMEGHVLWTHARCEACEKREAPCMWPSAANSALIAAAVNALPFLLDEIERLQKQIETQENNANNRG